MQPIFNDFTNLPTYILHKSIHIKKFKVAYSGFEIIVLSLVSCKSNANFDTQAFQIAALRVNQCKRSGFAIAKYIHLFRV